MAAPLFPIQDNSRWQQEEILVDARRFYDALLSGIRSAEKTIDLDYYIFTTDALGQQVMGALEEAAHRGVAIRLILDGFGSAENAHEIACRLQCAGIGVCIYHPHPFYPSLYRWSITQGNFLRKFIHFLLYINHRDHHKLCIIDSRRIWTGSLNITADHLPKSEGGGGWHDYGVILTDENIQSIQHGFNSLWGLSQPRERLPPLQKIRSNLSLRLRKISNRWLVRKLQAAESRIWICHAYFAPSYRILRALYQGCRKGVDVRLILPAHSDVQFFPWLSRTYYRSLMRQGVRIYEYQPAILHAKLMLIDDECMIGSTNMNHRSYYHDLEMDIVLSQPESIREIEYSLLADMNTSREITLVDMEKHSIALFFSRFLRLFKYWL